MRLGTHGRRLGRGCFGLRDFGCRFFGRGRGFLASAFLTGNGETKCLASLATAGE